MALMLTAIACTVKTFISLFHDCCVVKKNAELVDANFDTNH